MATEDVDLAGVRFLFTRVSDPDKVLDEMAAEADLRDRFDGKRTDDEQLHLPYWAELWDSARGIGIHLAGAMKNFETASRMGQARRLRVLDLGCGMGMAGTVAAALGADVVFADLEPPALLFAQLNSLPWRKRVRARRLNWQRDSLDRRFDLIIGADILYERAQWPFLETFWRRHLAEEGQILLGEPGRQTGDLFIEWIVARGWMIGTTEIAVTTRPRPIRIFTVSKSNC